MFDGGNDLGGREITSEPLSEKTRRTLSVAAVVLLLVADVLVVLPLGALLVMGSDPCLGGPQPGDPLICTATGQVLTSAFPWGGAALGAVLAVFGQAWRRGTSALPLAMLGWLVTVVGVVVGFTIATGAG